MVRLSRAVDCRIYNVTGTMIFSGHEVTEIDVSPYPAGIYIIVTGEGQYLKLIKNP
jgi:hypothetical protein